MGAQGNLVKMSKTLMIYKIKCDLVKAHTINKQMIIKPSIKPVKTPRFNPPTGWYRAKLLEYDFKQTRKGNNGIRFKWEVISDPHYSYEVFSNFCLKKPGLLSRAMYRWKGLLFKQIPKVGPYALPDFIQFLGEEADIGVLQDPETGASIAVEIMSPSSKVVKYEDGTYTAEEIILNED